MRSARGRPGQAPHEVHRFLAAGAERRGQGCWRHRRRRLPVQEGQHPLPRGLGRGAEPAEGAHALKAARQHVLEEAMQEALRREAHRARLGGLAIAIGEGDALGVVADDALGAEGGAIDIRRQVLQGRLAAAHRLDIGHPGASPDGLRNLGEERGMVLLESGLEAGAEARVNGSVLMIVYSLRP